jgi:hypothetical protein
MIPQIPPKPVHELRELCASCLVLECTGRDQYHMNASICGRHEPVTLEHLRAFLERGGFWQRAAKDAEKELAQAQRAVVVLSNWKRTILARMGCLLDTAANGRGSFEERFLEMPEGTPPTKSDRTAAP